MQTVSVIPKADGNWDHTHSLSDRKEWKLTQTVGE